jgi:hypothetical protein
MGENGLSRLLPQPLHTASFALPLISDDAELAGAEKEGESTFSSCQAAGFPLCSSEEGSKGSHSAFDSNHILCQIKYSHFEQVICYDGGFVRFERCACKRDKANQWLF